MKFGIERLSYDDIDFDEEWFVTTIDNPFDPKDQFDEWYSYDISHGYNTCGWMARLGEREGYSSELPKLESELIYRNVLLYMVNHDLFDRTILVIKNRNTNQNKVA